MRRAANCSCSGKRDEAGSRAPPGDRRGREKGRAAAEKMALGGWMRWRRLGPAEGRNEAASPLDYPTLPILRWPRGSSRGENEGGGEELASRNWQFVRAAPSLAGHVWRSKGGGTDMDKKTAMQSERRALSAKGSVVGCLAPDPETAWPKPKRCCRRRQGSQMASREKRCGGPPWSPVLALQSPRRLSPLAGMQTSMTAPGEQEVMQLDKGSTTGIWPGGFRIQKACAYPSRGSWAAWRSGSA